MTMCSQYPGARPILHILGLGVAGIHWHETKHKPAKREVTQMCILIIDDHLSLLTLLTIFLEEIGYEVVTARNGREALAWLRHSNALPRLILLDLAMPVMTGGEFLREQQRDSRLAALPVILMTALGRFDYESTTASVVAHLEKPLELDALATLLHEYAEPQLVARAVGG